MNKEKYDNHLAFEEDKVIIVIGASADGIKYLEAFLEHTPDEENCSIVVMQHQLPDSKSNLSDILNRVTSLTVTNIEDGLEIRGGYLYVSPPGMYVTITSNKFRTEELSQLKKHLRLPIDHLLRSVAVSKQENVVAVILSGTGSDGSLGIKEVKSEGGFVVVQDPKNLKFSDMPRNAIDTGIVDAILPIEKIPGYVQDYIRQRVQKKNVFDRDDTPELLNELHEIIKDETRLDFKDYKQNTLNRRISRRMAVRKADTLKEYVNILRESQQEVQMLYKDFLIGVTSFFRDNDAFQTLYDEVFPQIFSDGTSQPVRIWVTACATGEEAYSMAILVKEFMKSNNLRRQVQIFASDIDKEALEYARTGKYPENISADLPDTFLNNYFLKLDNHYQVHKDLRDMIVFAKHDLLSDPPYSRVDLVTCRNFLIYLNKNKQEHVFKIFSYALNQEGYLFLGKSESKNSLETFAVFNQKSKILVKKKDNTAIREILISSKFGHFDKEMRGVPEKKSKSLPQVANEIATRQFMDPLLFVDHSGTVLYSLGKCDEYFEFPVGEPSNKVQDFAAEGLRIPISNALKKVVADEKHEVTYEHLKLLKGDDIVILSLKVRKMTEYPRIKGVFMIQLKTQNNISISGKKEGANDKPFDVDQQEYIKELEADLREAREYLRNVIEELEIANEELKSTNEEAQSTNEELQSSNEELETAKEESQSLNEELETANDELQRKIIELRRLNDDLNNFLTSTQIGNIFLDKDLIIRRFTRHINSIIDLSDTDIGKPIEKFAISYENQNLIYNVKQVLETLIPFEKEIRANNKRYFWMRILPYRTVQDSIEGAVVTFTDITELKKAQRLAASHQKQYKQLFSHMNNGFALCQLTETDENQGIQINDINNAFRKLFFYINFEDGQFSDMLPANIRKEVIKTAVDVAQNGFSHAQEYYFENIDKHLRLHYFSHKKDHFALLVEDISNLKQELQTRQHLSSIVESSDDAIYSESPEGRILSWNKGAERLYGFTETEIEGKISSDFFASEKFDHNSELLAKVRQGVTVQHHETLHKTKSGNILPVAITKSPIKDANGVVLAISNIVKNNTYVKEREKALVEAKEATEKAAQLQSAFLANMSHEIRTPLNSILGYTDLMLAELEGEKTQKWLKTINNSGNQLLQLINDIVDVSKLEAGEVTLHHTSFDVVNLVVGVYEELAYQCNTKTSGVDFRYSIPKGISNYYIKTDKTRLKQVLYNLIHNAFKFTEKGYVDFGFKITENNEKITFFVKDTGIGISETFRERIFNRFHQGEQVSDKAVRGTGLGLSISKGLTGLLNGEMWLESEKGKGSTFYISLPVVKEDITKEKEIKENMSPDNDLRLFSGKKVLLVEDDEYSMEMMRYMLERHDIECHVATDGEKALEVFNKEKVDLVLLDIRLPKIDGHEVMKQITKKNKNLPVIAQSAFAMADEIQKAKKAGFTDYITKPVTMTNLDKLLDKYLGKDGHGEK